MKKWCLLITLAVLGFSTLPATTEACWRRRCHYSSCQPVVVNPYCQVPVVSPGYQPIRVSPGYAPAVGTPAAASVTIGRKTYFLLDTLDQGAFSEKAEPPTATAAGVGSDDTFSGHDRLVPKTTIFDAAPTDFETVAALVGSILQNNSDLVMQQQSGITRATDKRVDAEKMTVRITGYIYAFKKEGDNDYHVILGDAPGAANPDYMNVEVSGIPVGGTAANRNTLIAVRQKFKQALHLSSQGPNGYKKPHEPIPVRITGSLFWDVDHLPGVVGPGNLKPKTSWEIHPVSAIEFLDEQASAAPVRTNYQVTRLVSFAGSFK